MSPRAGGFNSRRREDETDAHHGLASRSSKPRHKHATPHQRATEVDPTPFPQTPTQTRGWPNADSDRKTYTHDGMDIIGWWDAGRRKLGEKGCTTATPTPRALVPATQREKRGRENAIRRPSVDRQWRAHWPLSAGYLGPTNTPQSRIPVKKNIDVSPLGTQTARRLPR